MLLIVPGGFLLVVSAVPAPPAPPQARDPRPICSPSQPLTDRRPSSRSWQSLRGLDNHNNSLRSPCPCFSLPDHVLLLYVVPRRLYQQSQTSPVSPQFLTRIKTHTRNLRTPAASPLPGSAPCMHFVFCAMIRPLKVLQVMKNVTNVGV